MVGCAARTAGAQRGAVTPPDTRVVYNQRKLPHKYEPRSRTMKNDHRRFRNFRPRVVIRVDASGRVC
jgi:hypothetical protein